VSVYVVVSCSVCVCVCYCELQCVTISRLPSCTILRCVAVCCIFRFVQVYTCVRECVCMWCMYMCTCVYMYVHVYMYIHVCDACNVASLPPTLSHTHNHANSFSKTTQRYVLRTYSLPKQIAGKCVYMYIRMYNCIYMSDHPHTPTLLAFHTYFYTHTRTHTHIPTDK